MDKKLKINGKLAVINGKNKGTFNGVAWDNTPTPPPTIYAITPTLINVTGSSSNPTTIQRNGTATLHFTANTGYELPDSIRDVSGVRSYSWDKATGTLNLNIAISDVTFIIGGEPIPPQGETWLIKASGISYSGGAVTANINFTSNGYNYTQFNYYSETNLAYNSTVVYSGLGWVNENYRTVYFPEPPTGALRLWLQTNATLQ